MKMDVRKRQPIGIELVKRGIVTEADIEMALQEQKRDSNKKLGEILNELNVCDSTVLIEAIGEIIGVKGIILSPEKISNFQLYGYHITEINNLKLIKKEGLVPKCGKRSREIGDYRKVIYFFPALILMDNWRKVLYKDTNSASLALLRFNLDNVDITITDKDSWDLFGDWYTKDPISPEKIEILKCLDQYGNPFHKPPEGQL